MPSSSFRRPTRVETHDRFGPLSTRPKISPHSRSCTRCRAEPNPPPGTIRRREVSPLGRRPPVAQSVFSAAATVMALASSSLGDESRSRDRWSCSILGGAVVPAGGRPLARALWGPQQNTPPGIQPSRQYGREISAPCTGRNALPQGIYHSRPGSQTGGSDQSLAHVAAVEAE